MGEIEFIFQVKDYDSDALLSQVSRALQRRMELRTQRVKPGQPDPSQMTEAQRKFQDRMKKIWGVVFLVLGFYFMYSAGRNGSVLSMQGIIGIVAIVWGVSRLMPKRKVDPERYNKAAKEFLDGHKENLGDKEHQICFSDEEMIIVTGAVEELDQEAVTYGEVDFSMETEDIFLLVHGGHGVMLQKKDITLGTVEEFRAFLASHIRSFTPYEPEEQEGAAEQNAEKTGPAEPEDVAEEVEETAEESQTEATDDGEETQE